MVVTSIGLAAFFYQTKSPSSSNRDNNPTTSKSTQLTESKSLESNSTQAVGELLQPLSTTQTSPMEPEPFPNNNLPNLDQVPNDPQPVNPSSKTPKLPPLEPEKNDQPPIKDKPKNPTPQSETTYPKIKIHKTTQKQKKTSKKQPKTKPKFTTPKKEVQKPKPPAKEVPVPTPSPIQSPTIPITSMVTINKIQGPLPTKDTKTSLEQIHLQPFILKDVGIISSMEKPYLGYEPLIYIEKLSTDEITFTKQVQALTDFIENDRGKQIHISYPVNLSGKQSDLWNLLVSILQQKMLTHGKLLSILINTHELEKLDPISLLPLTKIYLWDVPSTTTNQKNPLQLVSSWTISETHTFRALDFFTLEQTIKNYIPKSHAPEKEKSK